MKLILITLFFISYLKANPALMQETIDVFHQTLNENLARQLKNCLVLDKNVCLYQSNFSQVEKNKLIIYFRGHWGEHRGEVPDSMRSSSLMQVINFYDLDKTANLLNQSFLITSSSHISFYADEIQGFLLEANFKEDSEVILVAHSGGYNGLFKTLKKFKNSELPYKFKLKKIILLDNFYFSESATNLYKEYFDQGVECSGFYTAHNEKRYQDRFLRKISKDVCPIEKRIEHNSSVNECLEKYVQGTSCL